MNNDQNKETACEKIVPLVVSDLQDAEQKIIHARDLLGSMSKKTPNRLQRVDRCIKIQNLLSALRANVQFDAEVYVDRK